MDEEFNLENTRGRKKAQMGRRANKESEDSQGGGPSRETTSGGASTADQQPKRRGGWGDEPPRTAGGGGRRAVDDELGENFDRLIDSVSRTLKPVEKFKEKTFSESDDDGDAQAIPELKEELAAPAVDETPQVAVAPSIAVNRVATYRELDFDLNRHASFATLDNEIDLKLLTRCLTGDQDLVEPDEYWDWDRLFTEVTSDLLTDSGDTDGGIGPASAGDQNSGGAVAVK